MGGWTETQVEVGVELGNKTQVDSVQPWKTLYLSLGIGLSVHGEGRIGMSSTP